MGGKPTRRWCGFDPWVPLITSMQNLRKGLKWEFLPLGQGLPEGLQGERDVLFGDFEVRHSPDFSMPKVGH